METGGVVTGVAAADPKIEYYKEGIAQNCEKLVFLNVFHVDIKNSMIWFFQCCPSEPMLIMLW